MCPNLEQRSALLNDNILLMGNNGDGYYMGNNEGADGERDYIKKWTSLNQSGLSIVYMLRLWALCD